MKTMRLLPQHVTDHCLDIFVRQYPVREFTKCKVAAEVYKLISQTLVRVIYMRNPPDEVFWMVFFLAFCKEI